VSIASKNQVTKDFVTQACPVGTHEDTTMADDMLYGSRCSGYTVHGGHKSLKTFELVIAKDGLHTGVWRRRC